MDRKHFQIFLKGNDETRKVLRYQRIGEKYEVTFNNGKTFRYNASNVRVIESELNKSKSLDCFEYLKRIVEVTGSIKGAEINLLSKIYDKIEFVSPTSIFGSFISGKSPSKSVHSVQEAPIYPFGFNISQKSAVEKALSNPLSLIEGPPGTGKTQTILNIIANVVMRGGSVAIVSNNNSATKNVYEKLQRNSVDFIAAYLGKKDNKEDFIASQKPLPDLSKFKLSLNTIDDLKSVLKRSHRELQNKLVEQNKLSSLRQQYSDIKTEQRHFLQNESQGIPSEYRKIKTSQEALDLWLLCENEQFLLKIGFHLVLENILAFLRRSNRNKRFIREASRTTSIEVIITVLQKLFYELKLAELDKSIAEITQSLEAYNFQAQMKNYAEISMQIFKSNLAGKYSEKTRDTYSIESLRSKSEEFIRDYPVILSTTHSVRTSLSMSVEYDFVIVDEASQVDLCSGALALSCAKRAVIVGDLKQLPHVVEKDVANLTDEIFAQSNLPEYYRYKNQSLLSSLSLMFPHVPKTLLREHYRCHPKIIEFCNRKFYSNQLIILTEPKDGREPLLVYKTVEGNHERNRMNQRQIDVIRKEIIPQQSLNTADGSLGIITPYRRQTNALQDAFKGLKVKADTVDKFQGQENSVVILSTVDNQVTDFSDNSNRLNVAISRAIDQLIVVVSEEDTQRDTNIGDLVRYIQYNNFTVTKSNIQSVFDYLYSSYSERRQELLSIRKKVSRFDSENLMYTRLVDILNGNKINSLKIATHVPLRMIINDMDLLNTEEVSYASHFNTHVDFLIYDRVSRVPKLIIEVDGTSFHEEGSKQFARDVMKNEILRKYALPFLRLRTDGSGEEKQILDLLGLETRVL